MIHINILLALVHPQAQLDQEGPKAGVFAEFSVIGERNLRMGWFITKKWWCTMRIDDFTIDVAIKTSETEWIW